MSTRDPLPKRRQRRAAQRAGVRSGAAVSPAPAAGRKTARSFGLVALLLIAVVGAIAYANVLHAPFEFDDEFVIVNNGFIKHIGSLRSLQLLWRWSPLRFLAHLTLGVNYAVGGLNVFGYHLANLAIHILAAWTVYWLTRLLQHTPALAAPPVELRLGALSVPREGALAALVALLFVSHPIQTGAVTYIVQRAASLAGLLYLLSLALYVQAALLRERGVPLRSLARGGALAGCWLVFALALLVKQNAATLPAAVLLTEWLLFGASAAWWRKRLRWLIPLAVVLAGGALGILALRGGGLADVGRLLSTHESVPRWSYFVTEINVVRTYVRLLFLPIGQNLDYEYPISWSLFEARTLLSALFLSSLLYLAWRWRRRRPLVSYGILFFFLTLSVESSIIPLPDVIFEHRLYLPSVGFFWAVGAGLFETAGRLASPGAARASPRGDRAGWLLACVTLALVTAATVATRRRNDLWRDPVTLWTDVVRKSPQRARAHHNLGWAYARAGRLPEAVAEFRQAVAIDPSQAKTYNSLGNAYQRLGRQDDAEAAYRRAMALDPKLPDAVINLGFLQIERGHFQRAKNLLYRAGRMSPFNPEVARGVAKLSLRQGLLDNAEAQYRRALQRWPQSADLHNELGEVYWRKQEWRKAEAEYRRTLELDPNYADAYNNLGNALLVQNRPAEAEAAYLQALARDRNDVEVRLNLARAYRVAGKPRQAEEQYRLVLATMPGSAEARQGLAEVLQGGGALQR